MTARTLTEQEFGAMRNAEECLLGAVLIEASNGESDRGVIQAVSMVVKCADFWDWNTRYPANQYQCRNGRIYAAMLTCSGAPHIVNVAREMTARKLLQPGDLPHMVHCQAEVPTHLDWKDYAEAVRYYSDFKRSIEAGGEIPKNQTIHGGVTLDAV